nr:tRNA (adenine(22)-N(1))-methyltransferase TrmK [Vibrio floridensis]
MQENTVIRIVIQNSSLSIESSSIDITQRTSPPVKNHSTIRPRIPLIGSETSVKLSRRIQALLDMVKDDYHHIWDCCCDHGYLGLALMEKYPQRTVHFVDIVPELIDNVSLSVQQMARTNHSNGVTHCIDVASLPLEQYPGKHLIIIAGVGGDLTLELVMQLRAKHPNQPLDFLLCPVHHLYMLRQALREMDFRLLSETLIEENRRFYELLHISNSEDFPQLVSPVGQQLWQNADKATAIRYQKKTVAHYQRIKIGQGEAIEKIIEHYQQIQFAD